MAPSLKSRLARLREAAAPAPGRPQGAAAGGAAGGAGRPGAGPARDASAGFRTAASTADAAAEGIALALAARGWSACAQGLWRRSLRFDPLPRVGAATRAGAAELARNADAVDADAVDAALGLPPLPGRPAGGGPTAFDLETTGLSGGAGTVAFLAAFARPAADGGVHIRQYFMEDYPAEPAFIAALDEELALAAPLVSYNGSSFDLPLYRGRCIMNGIRPRLPWAAIDLLHTARRLYKRPLGDCSLGSVERAVLGMERGPDLPGALVPEAYFRFLREGYHDELGLAMDHNAADVRALLELYGLVRLIIARALGGEADPSADAAEGVIAGAAESALGAGSGAAAAVAPDLLGLAWLAARADPGRATGILERAVAAGDGRAVRPLMRRYWKEDRKDERLRLAPRLPDDAAGLLTKSIYEERLRGDAAAALRLARAAAALGGPLADRAAARAARLARRVGL